MKTILIFTLLSFNAFAETYSETIIYSGRYEEAQQDMINSLKKNIEEKKAQRLKEEQKDKIKKEEIKKQKND